MPAEVEGAARLRTTLRRAGVTSAQLREPNRAAGRIVATAGRSSAPRRTGRLAATVRAAGSTPRVAVVTAGRRSVPYGGVIHWGWPARNIPSQPWLSDAARATEPVWIREYDDHVRGLINSVRGA